MRGERAISFSNDQARQTLTAFIGLFAALGWAIIEFLFELLLGPHVRWLRSMAIGAGLGAFTGLFVSAFQWLVLRGYVSEAGWLIPGTTVGATLAGMVGGLLLYFVTTNINLYGWNVPLQGAAGAIFVCLGTALAQWMLLRRWSAPGQVWQGWVATAIASPLLAAACACMAAAATMTILGSFLGKNSWPYILIIANVIAGMAGGGVYGRSITLGLRRALPEAPDAAGAVAESIPSPTPAGAIPASS